MNFAGFELEGVPIGPGTGSINGINQTEIRDRLTSILESPAAFAIYGSIGSERREGNSGETYYHDPETGVTLNSMGLPGLGIDDAEPIIGEFASLYRDAGKLLIVSATTFPGQNAVEVLPTLMYRITDAGNGLVVPEANFSCPNVYSESGERKPILSYDPDAVEELNEQISTELGADVHWQAKIAPFWGEHDELLEQVADVLSLAPTQVGISGFNTVVGESRTKPNGTEALRFFPGGDESKEPMHVGGMSGPAVSDEYLLMQAELLRFAGLDRAEQFLASGGIMTGDDAKERTSGVFGARLAAAVTRFWEGDKVGKTFGRTATEMAEEFLAYD